MIADTGLIKVLSQMQQLTKGFYPMGELPTDDTSA